MCANTSRAEVYVHQRGRGLLAIQTQSTSSLIARLCGLGGLNFAPNLFREMVGYRHETNESLKNEKECHKKLSNSELFVHRCFIFPVLNICFFNTFKMVLNKKFSHALELTGDFIFDDCLI